MGNKADLQQHNIDLASILAVAQGLPLEQVIKALASTGQYAWKKYEQISGTINVSGAQVGSTLQFTLSSNDLDVSQITMDDLIGKQIGFYTYIGNQLYVEITSNTKATIGGNAVYDCSYDSSTHIITVQTVLSSTVPVTGINIEGINQTILLGITVDNSPTAYPDGGVQDGYFYERLNITSGIDYGEVTISGLPSSVTVNHALGVTPSYVALFPKSATSFRSTTVAQIMSSVNILSNFKGLRFLCDSSNLADASFESDGLNANSESFTLSTQYSSTQRYNGGTYWYVAIA